MHGFKAVYPFGTAYTITFISFYMGAYSASLSSHVIYDGLTKFPMNGTVNRDVGLNCKLVREKWILVFISVPVSEVIQNGLF
jgi:hypothetical protein